MSRAQRSMLRQYRWFIVAAVAVLLVFVFVGGLSPLLAVAGFVVLAAAMLLPASRLSTGSTLSPKPAAQKAEFSHLQAIINAIPNPLVVIDRNGMVVALNTPARIVAPALRAGQLASLALRAPDLIEALRRAIVTGGAQRLQYAERAPIERWYEAHVVPARLALDAPASSDLLLLSFNDLTSLRRMDEMRADFVANASHELRTPLAALSGFIDTLQGPARDDPIARERFLEIMRAQASRMARLIDDLLSLSRIELSEHIEPDSPIDLVSALRQVLDALQTLAHERQVEVTLTASSEPVVVRGDRDELIRVFENLVENALKYGSSGKRVDIKVETRPGQEAGNGEAKVSVRDYGPGIAPEHVPRLTERFYRVDVGQSRAEGGTGLGLALVKHILNRHRGRLSIESTLGAGSTFTVHLPLAGNPDSAVRDSAAGAAT